MSEQNQAPQNEEELNAEELEDVAGGVGGSDLDSEFASTNNGCTNYGCS